MVSDLHRKISAVALAINISKSKVISKSHTETQPTQLMSVMLENVAGYNYTEEVVMPIKRRRRSRRRKTPRKK